MVLGVGVWCMSEPRGVVVTVVWWLVHVLGALEFGEPGRLL